MKWLLIGGGVGGALTILLALGEQKELKRRGTLTQAAMERGGSALEVRLQSMGADFREEIQEQAQQLGEQIAEATAREWLAVKYGLTEELITSMQSSVPAIASRIF